MSSPNPREQIEDPRTEYIRATNDDINELELIKALSELPVNVY